MVGLQVQKNANSLAVAAMAMLCISGAMMYPGPPGANGAAPMAFLSRKSDEVRDLEMRLTMDRSAKTEDRTSRLESSMANMQLAQATMGQDVKYIVEALKSIFAALAALAVLIVGYLLTRLPQIIGQSQKPD